MFAQLTPWVRRLILATSLGTLLPMFFPRTLSFLAFSPSTVITHPWAIFTQLIFHSGIAHMTNTVLPLFWLGPRLEARLGGRRFMSFYFLTGTGGAVIQGILNPHVMLLVGPASATAVSVGAAYVRPREWITLFPLPIRLPSWVVAVATTTISVLYALGGSMRGTADAAHVGAALVGIGLLKWWGTKVADAPPQLRPQFE